MDIIALHKELISAGFAIEMEDIGALVEQFRRAIAEGKVKRSTSPTQSCYPLVQVFRLLLPHKKDINIAFEWNNAIRKNPRLIDFKTIARYALDATRKRGAGVASLSLEGIIHLAAALGFKAEGSAVVTVCGQIYVLKDPGNKALKLGYSKQVETRMLGHKSSHPFLVPIAVFSVSADVTENKLHRHLSPHRIEGTREWYTDNPETRRALCEFFISAGIDEPTILD